MSSSALEILPKIGLIIGFFFSVLPLPLLYRAAKNKDQREIMSLSLPATIMGMTCTSVIYSFCSLKGLEDCVTSTYMGFASGGLTLLVMYYLKRDYRTLMIIAAVEIFLGYAVYRIFSDQVTNILTMVINTLACVVMPLDTIEKVLKTKDLNYVNYFLHGLGVINGIIWTLYHYFNRALPLALANALGLLCEGFLFLACLYASGYIPSQNHPAVALTFKFVEAFFVKPKHILEDFTLKRFLIGGRPEYGPKVVRPEVKKQD
jgi:hypothetical protein